MARRSPTKRADKEGRAGFGGAYFEIAKGVRIIRSSADSKA